MAAGRVGTNGGLPSRVLPGRCISRIPWCGTKFTNQWNLVPSAADWEPPMVDYPRVYLHDTEHFTAFHGAETVIRTE